MKPSAKLCLLLAVPLVLAACSKSASIDGLKTFKYASGEHVEGQIKYASLPPAGGAHNPRWQKCGVYDQPLYDQYAVHSMEHGAVWIAYQPTLPAAELVKLKAAVAGRSYTLLSPYPGLSAPITASAWNAQVALKSADDARLGTFLSTYEQGPTTPERGAACDGPYSTTETQ